MVTFEEISVFLEHPFVVLVVGALISGVLVAWLTNWWQNRRKEREVKVDIASKMLEVYGSVAAKTFLSSMRREPISNIDEVLEKFVVGAYIVDSMLDSYYSSKTAILDRWSDFFDGYVPFIDATSLYFVEARTEDEKSSLEDDLDKIKKYFSINKERNTDRLTADKPIDAKLRRKIDGLTTDKHDHELWKEIDDVYWDRVSKIYKDVLDPHIKVL